MTDVLRNLPSHSFKGIAFPVVQSDFGFSLEIAERKFLFKNDPLPQNLGRKSRTFRYTACFSEDIVRGPYSHLFSQTYSQFQKACADGVTGELLDAVEGVFQAKCSSFSYGVNPSEHRDGIWVEVEFVHDPGEADETEQQATVYTLSQTSDQAGALDNLAAKVDWKQEIPPKPFKDPFTAISSAANQINTNISQTAAKLDSVAFKINKMNASLEKLADVKNYPVIRSSNNLKFAVNRTKANLTANGKIVRNLTTSAPVTLSVLAAELKMPIKELLSLNPTLSNSPLVPANTKVKYTASS